MEIRTVAFAALLSLTAAAAPAAPPPTGGTVAIEARTADGEYDPALNTFIDALGAALTARGFTILPDPAHAASIAEVTLARGDVGVGLTKDPNPARPTIGLGATVPLGTGRSNVAPLRRTRIALTLHRRGDAQGWSGAAVTVRAAGTREGGDDLVAATLTGALLRGYPAEPGAEIGVP